MEIENTYKGLINFLDQNKYTYTIQKERIEKKFYNNEESVRLVNWDKKIIKIDNDFKKIILKSQSNIFNISPLDMRFQINIFEFDSIGLPIIIKGDLTINGNFIQSIKIKTKDLSFLDNKELK